MKKQKLTALIIVAAMITGCEKDVNLVQPECEIITAINTANGTTTLTLQSGKKVTAPSRKSVGEKYCYN